MQRSMGLVEVRRIQRVGLDNYCFRACPKSSVVKFDKNIIFFRLICMKDQMNVDINIYTIIMKNRGCKTMSKCTL